MELSQIEQSFFNSFSELYPNKSLDILMQEYDALSYLLEKQGNDPQLLILSFKMDAVRLSCDTVEKQLLSNIFKEYSDKRVKTFANDHEKISAFIDVIELDNGTVDGTDITVADLKSALRYQQLTQDNYQVAPEV